MFKWIGDTKESAFRSQHSYCEQCGTYAALLDAQCPDCYPKFHSDEAITTLDLYGVADSQAAIAFIGWDAEGKPVFSKEGL